MGVCHHLGSPGLKIYLDRAAIPANQELSVLFRPPQMLPTHPLRSMQLRRAGYSNKLTGKGEPKA
jgi:hypothetical protein